MEPCAYVDDEEAYCIEHFSDYCAVPVDVLKSRLNREHNFSLRGEGRYKKEVDKKQACTMDNRKFYPLGALIEADIDLAVSETA